MLQSIYMTYKSWSDTLDLYGIMAYKFSRGPSQHSRFSLDHWGQPSHSSPLKVRYGLFVWILSIQTTPYLTLKGEQHWTAILCAVKCLHSPIFRLCTRLCTLCTVLCTGWVWENENLRRRDFYLPKFQDKVQLKFWKSWTFPNFRTISVYIDANFICLWYAWGQNVLLQNSASKSPEAADALDILTAWHQQSHHSTNL